MAKTVTFAEGTSFPPAESSSDSKKPSSTSQGGRKVITRRPKRSRPLYRYLLCYFISSSSCYDLAKAKGILANKRDYSVHFFETMRRLRVVGAKSRETSRVGLSYVQVGAGFCVTLAEGYSRNQFETVDEELKREVQEAIGTDEEPTVIRVPV